MLAAAGKWSSFRSPLPLSHFRGERRWEESVRHKSRSLCPSAQWGREPSAPHWRTPGSGSAFRLQKLASQCAPPRLLLEGPLPRPPYA